MKLSYFKKVLRDTITAISNINPEKECIDICNWTNQEIRSDEILYILPYEKFNLFSNSVKPRTSPVVLLSGCQDKTVPNSKLGIICCNLDHDSLWNTISEGFHLLQHYDHLLIHAIVYKETLTHILHEASIYWNASFYLFDNGGLLLHAAEDEKNTIDYEAFLGIDFDDYFSTYKPTSYDEDIVMISTPFSKSTTLLKKIEDCNKKYWLIMSSSHVQDLHLLYALRLTGNFITRYIEQDNVFIPDNKDFNTAVCNILSGKITNSKEIFKILCPNATENTLYYFRPIIIFGNHPFDAKTLTRIQAILKKNLPEMHFVPYEGRILGIRIYSSDKNEYEQEFAKKLWDADYHEGDNWLRDYLQKNNYQCIIDEANSKFSTFKTCWTICTDLIRICRRDPANTNKVCIRADINRIYYVIDLAYKQFYDNVAKYSPILLSNPIFLILHRYDTQHNTSLTNVLLSYMKNSQNIEKTSVDCFMHRNTVKSKIKLIQTLTNIDFNNSDEFISLSASYYMYRYFINCQGGDLAEDMKNMT